MEFNNIDEIDDGLSEQLSKFSDIEENVDKEQVEQTNIISSKFHKIFDKFSNYSGGLSKFTTKVIGEFDVKRKNVSNAIDKITQNLTGTFKYVESEFKSILVVAGLVSLIGLLGIFSVTQLATEYLWIFATLFVGLVLILTGWVGYKYWKILNRKKEDFLGIKELQNGIDSDELKFEPVPKLPDGGHVDVEKANLTESIVSMKAYIKSQSPLLKHKYARANLLAMWHAKIDSFRAFLKYFKIDYKNFLTKESVEYLLSNVFQKDDELWDNYLIKHISSKLKVNVQVMNLLFSKYSGTPTRDLWEVVKSDEVLLSQIENILLSFDKKVKGNYLSEKDFNMVLLESDDFDLVEISQKVGLVLSILD